MLHFQFEQSHVIVSINRRFMCQLNVNLKLHNLRDICIILLIQIVINPRPHMVILRNTQIDMTHISPSPFSHIALLISILRYLQSQTVVTGVRFRTTWHSIVNSVFGPWIQNQSPSQTVTQSECVEFRDMTRIKYLTYSPPWTLYVPLFLESPPPPLS